MSLGRWLPALGVLLIPSLARADLLAPGERAVINSIRVEGEVAAGKILVLSSTFQGIDILQLSQTAKVDWNPAEGKMRIVAIGSTPIEKLESLRKANDQKGMRDYAAGGKPCSEPFEGVRRVPIDNPEYEIRWIWSVAFPGGVCKASLVRTEYLDKAGQIVKTTTPTSTAAPAATPALPDDPNARTPANSPPSVSSSVTVPGNSAVSPPSSSASSASSAAASPAAQSGCGCAIPGTSPPRNTLFATATLLGATLALRRAAARRRHTR